MTARKEETSQLGGLLGNSSLSVLFNVLKKALLRKQLHKLLQDYGIKGEGVRR